MIVFRSVLFFSFLIVWTCLVGTVSSLTLLTLNPKVISHVAIAWTKGIIYVQKVLCGIKVKVKGLENLPKKPFILASKHQSAWETLYFYYLFTDVVFILKKELFYIPLFGWYLFFVKMIHINRTKGARAIRQIIEGVKTTADKKRIVCIFPEGTRSLTHEKLPLKPGIAAIHNALPNLPIIPVALNSGEIWPTRSWIIKPGTITVKFLPPLPRFTSKYELLQKLQDDINSDPNL